MHGLRAWLAGGPAGPMADTLARHRANSARSPVHTFLGNHDVARLADVLPAAALPLAFAVLLTLPGVPGIYYGDEVALTSDWTSGAPDALLRPALDPTAIDHAPTAARGLLTTVQGLAGFRRANRWLATATLGTVTARGRTIGYEVRDDRRAVTVLLNPTPDPVSFPGPVRGRPVLGVATDHGTGIELPPHGWALCGAVPPVA